jgi:hypothetical protein
MQIATAVTPAIATAAKHIAKHIAAVADPAYMLRQQSTKAATV